MKKSKLGLLLLSSLALVAGGAICTSLTIDDICASVARAADDAGTDSQDEIESVIDLISEIDESLLSTIEKASNAYNSLSEESKALVTNYDILQKAETKKTTNYILFNNALSADSISEIKKVGDGWSVPSSVQYSESTKAYEGKGSTLKIGSSKSKGSIQFKIATDNYYFGNVTIGAKKYGSDNGSLIVSGTSDLADKMSLLADMTEKKYDLSSQSSNALTISTTSKRAYICYVYFEVFQSDVTMTNIISAEGTLSKTTYYATETFDSSGLTFKTNYSDGTQKAISAENIVWSPSVLTTDTTSVVGTYTENGIEATITISGLTVKEYESSSYGYVGKNLADFDGEYYLAYVDDDGNAYVYDGNTSDNTNGYKLASIANDTIISSVPLDSCLLTIGKTNDGYSIMNSEAELLCFETISSNNSSEKISKSDEGDVFGVKIDDDGYVSISNHSSSLDADLEICFNSSSNQMRFRGYKPTSGQKKLKLFRKNTLPTTTISADISKVKTSISNTESKFSLSYNDSDFDGSDVNTISDIQMRFGGLMSQDDWLTIADKVQEYGVMAKVTSKVSSDIETDFNENKSSFADMTAFANERGYSIVNVTDGTYPFEYTDSINGDCVVFNGYINVSTTHIDTMITAVAYIKISDEYVFFGKREMSPAKVAYTYLNNSEYSSYIQGHEDALKALSANYKDE